jgi:hypothetical protein
MFSKRAQLSKLFWRKRVRAGADMADHPFAIELDQIEIPVLSPRPVSFENEVIRTAEIPNSSAIQISVIPPLFTTRSNKELHIGPFFRRHPNRASGLNSSLPSVGKVAVVPVVGR